MKRFDITPETMVVTSTYITEGKLPILYVAHELGENGEVIWQFHCGNDDYDMKKMQLVRLDTILRIDPTINDISDLPLGFVAKRVSIGSVWNRIRE